MPISEKKLSGSDIFLILIKWRKFILINFFGVCIIVAIISFIIPKWYKSEASIFPPENESFNFGMVSSLMSMLPSGGGMELPMLATPSDVYNSILQSRSVLDSVIIKNDLISYYKLDNYEDTRAELKNHLKTSVGDEGIVRIAVEAKDKHLALKMTKDFIEQLDIINREKRKTKGQYTREFIEERLRQNKEELSTVERNLKDFQEETNLISLEDQTSALISVGAQLIAELKVQEIELGVMENTFDSAHSKVILIRKNIAEIKKQLSNLGFVKLDQADQNNSDDPSGDVYIPMNQLPELSLEYFQLFRDVKVQEAIFEFLVEQYEQAKIQENRDTPTIQILDEPILAEKKCRPQRKLMVIIAGILSLTFSAVFIYFAEYLHLLKKTNPKSYNTFISGWKLIKKDFNKFLRRK